MIYKISIENDDGSLTRKYEIDVDKAYDADYLGNIMVDMMETMDSVYSERNEDHAMDNKI